MDDAFVVRCWLAIDPAVGAQPDTIMAILDSLCRLGEDQAGFTLRLRIGDSARSYQLTERGLRAVRNAVMRNPQQDISVLSEIRSYPDMREIVANIDAAVNIETESLSSVSVHASWVGNVKDDPHPIAAHLRIFNRMWIEALPSISGYVSDNTADWYRYTAYEREQNAPLSSRWPVANMPVRGAFWANFLGSDQCERLGGRDYILAHAPVSIREPLGDGVWLQCGEYPPASEQQIEDLLAFFAPVLVRPDPNANRRSGLREYTPVMPDGLPPDDAPGVPIEVLPDAEVSEDLPFTVYLAAPFTDKAQQAVTDAVNRWNQAGEAKAYGGSGFATLIGPHVDPDDPSISWMVDLGWCDPEVAVNALARVLYAVPDEPVSRLVIGHETIE